MSNYRSVGLSVTRLMAAMGHSGTGEVQSGHSILFPWCSRGAAGL